jgi:hypothetical protein
MARKISLGDIDDYVAKQLKTLVRAATLESDRRLKLASPVDTGRFRSSWQIEQQEFSGSVSNNLPYAERLANGWSKQAPAGWIDATAKDVQTYIDAEAARIGKQS